MWLAFATLIIIPLHNHLAGTDAYRYSIFYMVMVMWIGVWQPRWTVTKMSPFFVVSYLVPLMFPRHPAYAISSVTYCVPVFILGGEVLGWFLDDFKHVNDDLGHAAGDDVLIEVGRRLATCLRPNDTACRLGGDEFAILLEDGSGTVDALVVAERVLAALNDGIPVDGGVVTLGCSIGVAIDDGTATGEDLLSQADGAMYRAKGTGKGRFYVVEQVETTN
jgi:diguanylate cyclase (GGDEF)-like protein